MRSSPENWANGMSRRGVEMDQMMRNHESYESSRRYEPYDEYHEYQRFKKFEKFERFQKFQKYEEEQEQKEQEQKEQEIPVKKILKNVYVRILAEEGIYSKADYKKWLRKYHPDKLKRDDVTKIDKEEKLKIVNDAIDHCFL